jgi:hypothetical protein
MWKWGAKHSEKKLEQLKVCLRAGRTIAFAHCYLLDPPQRCVDLWGG